MPVKTDIGQALGKLNPFRKRAPAVRSAPAPPQTQNPTPAPAGGVTPTITQQPTLPLTTSTMTREQLKARRMARVENAHGLVEPMHIKVMLRFVDSVCTLTPFAIIALTTSELGQLFTGKPFNVADQTSINMYAAALVAECVFAACTFLWQYAAAYMSTLETASAEYARVKAYTNGLGWAWRLFALISAWGQFVYLRSFWHPQTADVFTWVLIVARVAMLIGADWACAKYLGWRVTTMKKIAMEEKAKGEIYQELERQEAARIKIEAEADQDLRTIQIQVETAERTARIANDVQEIMSKSAVKFLGQFMESLDSVMNNVLTNVNSRLQEPVDGEVREINEPPDTGAL